MTGSGGGTNTVVQNSQPPAAVMQAYGNLTNAAFNQAQQPLQQYGGSLVAGFTPQQQQAFSEIGNAQGMAIPYLNSAAQEFGQATSPLWPTLPQFSPGQIAGMQAGGLGAYGIAEQFGQNAAQIGSTLPADTSPYVGAMQGYAANAGTIAGTLPQNTQPYVGQASGLAGRLPNAAGAGIGAAMGAGQAITGGGVQNYGALGEYLSPYTQNVTNALQGLFNQQNAQQLQQIRGNAASEGAFGGDREAVAESLAAQQQQLAEAPALAQVEQQGFQQAQNTLAQQQQLQLSGLTAAGQLGLGAAGATTGAYGTAGQLGLGAGQLNLGALQGAEQGQLAAGQLSGAAGQLNLGALTGAAQTQLAASQPYLAAAQGQLGEFNTQQQQQLAAEQANAWLSSQAGFGLAGLGTEAQNSALTGASALMQSGALQQQLAQEQLNVPYQEFLQQQAYPYQQLGFLSPIIEGAGSLMGGTGSTQYPGPSLLGQIGGLGLTGLGVYGMGSQLGWWGGAGAAGAAGASALGGELAAEAPALAGGAFGLGSAAAASPWMAFAKRGGRLHRQYGGMAAEPEQPLQAEEPLPASMAWGASPNLLGLYREFASMPPEKLQELSVRLGNNPLYRPIVQRALQMSHMHGAPAAGTAQPLGANLAQPQGVPQGPGLGMAAGGGVIADEPDFDPQPVVDQSGPTVKVRYPSEGDVLDLGIPSVPQPESRAAGGRLHARFGAPAMDAMMNGVASPAQMSRIQNALTAAGAATTAPVATGDIGFNNRQQIALSRLGAGKRVRPGMLAALQGKISGAEQELGDPSPARISPYGSGISTPNAASPAFGGSATGMVASPGVSSPLGSAPFFAFEHAPNGVELPQLSTNFSAMPRGLAAGSGLNNPFTGASWMQPMAQFQPGGTAMGGPNGNAPVFPTWQQSFPQLQNLNGGNATGSDVASTIFTPASARGGAVHRQNGGPIPSVPVVPQLNLDYIAPPGPAVKGKGPPSAPALPPGALQQANFNPSQMLSGIASLERTPGLGLGGQMRGGRLHRQGGGDAAPPSDSDLLDLDQPVVGLGGFSASLPVPLASSAPGDAPPASQPDITLPTIDVGATIPRPAEKPPVPPSNPPSAGSGLESASTLPAPSGASPGRTSGQAPPFELPQVPHETLVAPAAASSQPPLPTIGGQQTGAAAWQGEAARDALSAGFSPRVFTAQMGTESSWNPLAVDPIAVHGEHATGIAQFLPSTARQFDIDPLNPHQSLRAGAQYDAELLRASGGDYVKALQRYGTLPHDLSHLTKPQAHLLAVAEEENAMRGFRGNPMNAAAPQVAANPRVYTVLPTTLGQPPSGEPSPAAGADTGNGLGGFEKEIADLVRNTAHETPSERAMASPWMGVLSAGLGMLASRSPYPGVALGEGGLKGLQSWEQAQGMVPKIQLAQAEAAQRELPLLEMPIFLRNAGVGGSQPPPGIAPGAPSAGLAAASTTGAQGMAHHPAMGSAPPSAFAAATTTALPASGAAAMPPEIAQRYNYDLRMERLASLFPRQYGSPESWNADANRLLTGTPAYQGQITSARNWAGVPPDIYKRAQEAPIAAWQAGLTKAQEFRYQFNQVRPGSAGLLGGKPVVVVPQPREYVNPVTGERYWGSWTPPVRSIPSTPPASASLPNRGPTSATSTAPSPQTASTSPSPTQGGALPPGMEGVAGLGPGQEEALKTRAEEVQKQRQDTINDAAAAQTNQTVLNEMESDAQNFTTGPFAVHKYAAEKYLRMLNPAFNQPVASYEDFIKELGIITRTTVRQVSSRAAVQEFSLIQQSLPNPEMSPLGLQQVTGELKGLNDYSIAKLVAQNQWEETHEGNLDNFEATFEQNISPYPFLVNRLPPQIKQNLFQHLAQTSEGRRELGLLRQQMQMIDESGLNAGAQ